MDTTPELSTTLPCTLDPDEWEYLSEGNQHLILKYMGDIPNFVGTVIRLRKVIEPLPTVQIDRRETIMENALQEKYLKDLVNEFVYMPHPLVGEMTRIKLLDVKNRDDFLAVIIHKIEKSRPEFRRKKTVNPQTNFELLFDYSFSLQKFSTHDHRYSSLSFEIRPKSALYDGITLEEFQEIFKNTVSKLQGQDGISIPGTQDEIESLYKEHFSKEGYEKRCNDEHRDRLKFTRFFKVQLKKRQDKRVEEFTCFDPHDFFKNDSTGIKKALKELLITPQNNLKVFIDGDETNLTEKKQKFIEIVEHLLGSQNFEKQESSYEKLLDKLGDILARILIRTSIIETVQKFQDIYSGSSLDMSKVIEDLEKRVKELEYKVPQEKIKAAVLRVYEKQKAENNENGDNKEDLLKLIEALVRFLVSIAFRDLSIFVNLQFLPQEEKEDRKFAEVLEEKGFKTLESVDSKYKIMYTVGLIDFHMKGIQHAYSHPTSTKELFGLLLKYLFETNPSLNSNNQ